MDSNIGFLKRSEDAFYNEMHMAVNTYFSKSGHARRGNRISLLRAIFILLCTGLVYGHAVFAVNPWYIKLVEAVVLGLCITVVGSGVAHDALHGTLYPGRVVNKLFGYTMDLLGSSGYLWRINHNAHHAFTNIHGKDGDIKDSSILRLSPHTPYKALHRYQHYTAPVIYACFYLIIVFVMNTLNIFGYNFENGDKRIKHSWSRTVEFCIMKLLYLAIWVVVPLLSGIPFTHWLAGYLTASVTAGLSLTLLFFMAHELDSSQFEQSNSGKTLSWAEHQINVTTNFRTHPVISFFIGGLNYQVEHHLFPGISSVYYADLSPIVAGIAKKHGMAYRVNDSFFVSLRSHFRLLKRLSVPPAKQSYLQALSP